MLKTLRDEGIRVDDEGYFSKAFGDHNEFELCVEPIGEAGHYLISIYKNRVTLINKLPVWAGKNAKS